MFAFLGILCLLKFKLESGSINFSRWLSLIFGCIFLTCCVRYDLIIYCSVAFNSLLFFSIKYSGFYSCLLGFFIIGKEFWSSLGNKEIDLKSLGFYFVRVVVILIIIPTIIYVAIFGIHLHILTKAGPHDSVMTSAFQASLEGGLASITQGQPLHVAHGSQITLRYNFYLDRFKLK
jgi:dolichyl-phosphate-mannose-protein mannosyltransferase